MDREELLKSVDAKVEEYFTEPSEEAAEAQSEEDIEKAVKKDPMEVGGSKGTADEGEQPKKPEEEEAGKNGRPKDPSKMSQRDAMGDAKVSYDKDVSSPAMKPSHETTVAKGITVSEEDYELLKKAKEAQKEEALRKSREETATLMKSVVSEAVAPLQKSLDALSTENAELKETISKLRQKPQLRKSISNIAAIEKSFGANEPGAEGGKASVEHFSKSEVAAAADELMKSGQITMEEAIELDMTGTLLNPVSRHKIERKLKG